MSDLRGWSARFGTPCDCHAADRLQTPTPLSMANRRTGTATGARLLRDAALEFGAAHLHATALVLLFSLPWQQFPVQSLPQRGIDPVAVADFYRITRLWLRYWTDSRCSTSLQPRWFAEIYLLLMTSLTGCVVPRACTTHGRCAPNRRLRRVTSPGIPQSARWNRWSGAVQHVAAVLRRRRFRVVVDGQTSGGEGLSARDRQPGLPRVTPRVCLLRWPWAHCSATAETRS